MQAHSQQHTTRTRQGSDPAPSPQRESIPFEGVSHSRSAYAPPPVEAYYQVAQKLQK